MKRFLTLFVVALSVLVSSTAFAKPLPVRINKAKAAHVVRAKVIKANPALKNAVLKAVKHGKGKVLRPKIRLPKLVKKH